jgi:cysteinyl-tRNA synthetase
MARNRKDWKKADEIRLKLKSMGIILEDKPEGTQWRYQE